LLAKTDLLTDMVGEFPELQGIMGTYYALHDDEHADVAAAASEHYQPRFSGDTLPATATGTAVALADKLETLVGIWGIGLQPTGDRDPFALRRHALGILRMLVEKRLPLSLSALLADAVALFAGNSQFKDPTADVLNSCSTVCAANYVNAALRKMKLKPSLRKIRYAGQHRRTFAAVQALLCRNQSHWRLQINVSPIS
jgi:glycyl-tRNA synthetase beta subunit